MMLILSAYWSVKCLNVVLVFETKHHGLKVFTFNPFVPRRDFLVELNETDELFPDKLNDMNGYKVNSLYLMQDRTKVMTKRARNKTIYWGRDYDAINSVFVHLNGQLNILKVNDEIFS